MEQIRYFSKIAGAKFIMPDGFEIVFAHGFFDLKEEDYKDETVLIQVMNNNPTDPRHGKSKFLVYKSELESIIKNGNPLLYKEGMQPTPLPKVKDSSGRVGTDGNALSEVELAQQDAALSRVRGKVTGELNTGAVSTTVDVNASTVDANLQAAVLGQNPRVAAAAQRTAQAAAGAQGGVSSNS